jgi:glycine cleavage system protein P-like pyridoxal-binding family
LRSTTIGSIFTNKSSNSTGGENATAISAAPWGSALVCLISYGYICMLGAEGLKNLLNMPF